MPSPFPGMDPYLEGSFWTVVHANLTEEVARQLAPRLRPRYVVRVQERFVISVADERSTTDMIADVSIPEPNKTRVGPATVLAEPPLSLDTVIPKKILQRSVEIRDVEERRLVTAIEILSRANKRGAGRAEYLKKRQQILLSPTHLVEIDFLRRGRRVPMRKPLPSFPYFVFVSRAELRPRVGVWPIGLREQLPKIPVPLLPGDSDVWLELQSAFSTIYELFGYDRSCDYSRPAKVPLNPEDAVWAVELVREWQKYGGAV